VLDDLARGRGGAEAARLLAAAEFSKHLLLLRLVVAEAEAARHPQAAETADAYDTLAGLQRLAPGPVDAVIRYPAVGVWACQTIQALRGPRPLDARPARLTAIAASAAVGGRASATLRVHADGPVVALPGVGLAVLPGPATGGTVALRTGPDGALLSSGGARVHLPDSPGTDGEGWSGTRVLSLRHDGRPDPLRLTVDDLDPYRFPSELVHGRLSAEQSRRFTRAVAAGWELLARHHAEVTAEVPAVITTLTPLAPLTAPHGTIVSASSGAAFGCVALSQPPDDRAAAVTFAHELRHAQLSALMDLFPLVRAAPHERFYAPWREDPRPLTGLLHGAYAFAGVVAFWGRQRHLETTREAALEADVRFARWRGAALGVARFLMGCDRLTEVGRRFVTGLLAELEEWDLADVPAEAATRARDEAARHLARWTNRHGPPPNPPGPDGA
jgi:HEXXH motif-containing protein